MCGDNNKDKAHLRTGESQLSPVDIIQLTVEAMKV